MRGSYLCLAMCFTLLFEIFSRNRFSLFYQLKKCQNLSNDSFHLTYLFVNVRISLIWKIWNMYMENEMDLDLLHELNVNIVCNDK